MLDNLRRGDPGWDRGEPGDSIDIFLIYVTEIINLPKIGVSVI